MYDTGEDVSEDAVVAGAWFSVAAASSNGDVRKNRYNSEAHQTSEIEYFADG
tara:strand:- start:8389 stop:8544 length:156 start_codon:yes stop_codon:yes gene_type:complete